MSNNPFLKQKNTNNRFNNLISDTQSVSSNNTFLQKKQKNIDVVTKVSDKKQTHMDVVTKVSDKKQTVVKTVSDKKQKVFVLEEEFPLLCESHSTLIENTLKFTDAVNTVIAEEIVEEAKVLPKWVSYSKQNGTTIVYEGSYILEKLRLEKEQQILENSPNTLMKNVMNKLQKKWEKFKVDYDLIYGDGSYAHMYILPPVYGPEYELDEEDYYDDVNSNEYLDTNEYFEEYIE
jgi:hypothetical protein